MKNENRRRSACITFNNFSFSDKSPGSDLSIIIPHAMSYMHIKLARSLILNLFWLSSLVVSSYCAVSSLQNKMESYLKTMPNRKIKSFIFFSSSHVYTIYSEDFLSAAHTHTLTQKNETSASKSTKIKRKYYLEIRADDT